MSYQKTARRLTVPLETKEHIKNAYEIFTELAKDYKQLMRSNNSVANKLTLAQTQIIYANSDLKTKANADRDNVINNSYYKKAT